MTAWPFQCTTLHSVPQQHGRFNRQAVGKQLVWSFQVLVIGFDFVIFLAL